MEEKYELAMKPMTIGNLTLKNRIVMPPIATYQSTEDGKVTSKMLEYYGMRATGSNLAMIITEHSYIDIRGKARKNQLSISSDEDIEGLKRLVDTIHQGGAKAIAQLNHAGSAAPSDVTGERAVAPSSVILPVSPMIGDGTAPEELTVSQIAEIVEQFACATKRAMAAGYDGVEIHSAHAYLLNQFYSPLTNHREDDYGGDIERRLRIHREIIQSVRSAVGKEFMLSLRLGGCDYAEGGNTIEDSVYASKALADAGVDMLNITGGMCRYTRQGHNEPGYFQDMSSAIKKAVSIPVMLTGGVKTLEDAETLLKNNAADLIGVGREILKNPYWLMEQMEK